MLPLIRKDGNAVPYAIRLLHSLSLLGTNTKQSFFQHSLLLSVICRMFLFRLYLSLMTSWANDSFSAFTAIKSSSLIYFSLNLQSPIQFKALLLPYPSVRPLTAGSTWSREGCWYAPRIPLSLPSVGLGQDWSEEKAKGQVFLTWQY